MHLPSVLFHACLTHHVQVERGVLQVIVLLLGVVSGIAVLMSWMQRGVLRYVHQMKTAGEERAAIHKVVLVNVVYRGTVVLVH